MLLFLLDLEDVSDVIYVSEWGQFIEFGCFLDWNCKVLDKGELPIPY